MIEKIPAVGASPEQLAELEHRMRSLFAVTPVSEAIEPNISETPVDPFLERVALVGEIVWYWPYPSACRAAIVTFSNSERHGGGCDLVVFERHGFSFFANVRRGRYDRGWTPRGSLE